MKFKGKCNCGKKPIGEWLITLHKTATTILLCKDCQPKHYYSKQYMQLIYGK